jgi:hypothetical protein
MKHRKEHVDLRATSKKWPGLLIQFHKLQKGQASLWELMDHPRKTIEYSESHSYFPKLPI